MVVFLPVAGVIFTALANGQRGVVRASFLGVVVLTTAGSSVLGLARDRQAAKAKAQAVAAVANLNTAVTGAGQPLVAVLGRVMLETDPVMLGGALDTLRQMALTGTMMQCGKADSVCRIRCAYYQLRNGTLELLGDPVGRATARPPRRQFKPADGRVSRRVIGVAKGSEVVRIPDVDTASYEEFEDYPGRVYKSLIAAPVHAGRQSFGLLVVDSDRPNSLTEADAEYVNVVAGVLGAGYAHHRSVLRLADGSTPNERQRTGSDGAPKPRVGNSERINADQPGGDGGRDDA